MNKCIRKIRQKHLQKNIAHRINFLHIANMTKLVISNAYQTIIIGSSLSDDNHRTIKGSSLLNLLFLPFSLFLQKLQYINTTRVLQKDFKNLALNLNIGALFAITHDHMDYIFIFYRLAMKLYSLDLNHIGWKNIIFNYAVALLWTIWLEQNNIIFNEKQSSDNA